MRLFEIFVDHKTQNVTTQDRAPRAASLVDASLEPRLSPRRSRAVFDLFVNGANVTARIAESEGTCVLRDLARAVADLGRAPKKKRLVRFYDDACELAIERLGDEAVLSVYRAGQVPEVMLYDERVPFADVYDSVKEAVEHALAARPHRRHACWASRARGAGRVAPEPVHAVASVALHLDRTPVHHRDHRVRQRHLALGAEAVHLAADLDHGRRSIAIAPRACTLVAP